MICVRLTHSEFILYIKPYGTFFQKDLNMSSKVIKKRKYMQRHKSGREQDTPKIGSKSNVTWAMAGCEWREKKESWVTYRFLFH